MSTFNCKILIIAVTLYLMRRVLESSESFIQKESESINWLKINKTKGKAVFDTLPFALVHEYNQYGVFRERQYI